MNNKKNLLKNFSRSRMAASCMLMSLFASQAYAYCTDSPVDGAAYKVINKGSDLLLNVASASTSDGANINTVANAGNNSQRFYARYQSSSHYWTLEAAHSGKLAEVASGSTSNGANVQQATADGGTNQEWELKQQTDGSYKIVNRNSSYSLTVAGSSEGSNVYQNADASASSQRWWLEPVTYTCGSSGTSSTEITLSGSAGNGQVALTWSQPPEINSLQIYYDTDSNPSGRTRLATLSTSATSYTASGLNNGTTYWFWVKYRTTSDSVWHNSNSFNATPSAGSASGFSVTGFASLAGSDGLSTTTGGAGGNTVTVSTCSALTSALASSDTLTIQIPDNTTIDCNTSGTTVSACQLACPTYQDPGKYTYRIPTSTLSCSDLGAVGTANVTEYAQRLTVKANKTLVGLGPNSAIEGATLFVYQTQNVIIRNLNIGNVNPHLIEAGDGVQIYESSHVVVDHVNFDMISDGHIDVNDSQNITASYNHFDGYNPYVCANQHWYTNAVDESQMTFHHNFWDYTAGRNPKLTGSTTRAHIYNNYWLEVTYFSVGVDDSAQVLLQANYFDDAARPHWNIGNGYINGNVSTNVYTAQSASGSYAVQDTGDSVLNDVTMYQYQVDDVYSLPDLVTETGAQ